MALAATFILVKSVHTAGNLRAAQGGASGSISIIGGAVVTLNRETANPVPEAAGPGFIVGRRSGGVATATIDGAGSTLRMEADGAAAFAMVGRETTGTLTISNGGSLVQRDLTAPSAP